MTIDDAIIEIKIAINYLDRLYACDDRDLLCPNPDGVAIALNILIKNLNKNQQVEGK